MMSESSYGSINHQLGSQRQTNLQAGVLVLRTGMQVVVQLAPADPRPPDRV
jgi:hypothetical protein